MSDGWLDMQNVEKVKKSEKSEKRANQLIRESVRKRVSSQGIHQTESLVSCLSYKLTLLTAV